MKLSILIPCYNESATLGQILDRVLAAPTEGYEKEVLVVDDASTDRSPEIAAHYEKQTVGVVRSIRKQENRGKGAAVREGLAYATGDILLIQDADLEYDPTDFAALLAPFSNPEVMVVYGSRIRGSQNRSYSRYYWGGRLLTLVTNLLYGCKLTDEATGYKVFRREALEGITLCCDGFDFCPELTAKFLRRGHKIHEVPIRYSPRSFEEGKKIRWSDGLTAIWTLLRYRWS